MRAISARWATAAGLTMALCACGGGGGGTNFIPAPPVTSPTPTPTPTPSPAPTPTPTSSAITIFPNITQDTQFAIVGYNASFWSDGLVSGGFAASYDAATKTYSLTVPQSGQSGPLINEGDGTDDALWRNGWIQAPMAGDRTSVSVMNQDKSDPSLLYTTVAEYLTQGSWPDALGYVAFGTGTTAQGVPTSGTATYNAMVVGSAGFDYAVSGSAALSFDFGAGTLAGHFDPILNGNGGSTALGRYDFVNTVFGAGSTGFSGELSNSAAATNGSFAGQFTGPNAEELMSRWTAPYVLPGGGSSVGTMFGVWVGKH